MLDELLKTFADEALRYGKIISDDEFKLGNDFKRSYCVEYMNRRYYLTKTNGEWTYFYEGMEVKR